MTIPEILVSNPFVAVLREEKKTVKSVNTDLFKRSIINLFKPTGYVMHQQVQQSTTVRSTHTVFTCFVFI